MSNDLRHDIDDLLSMVRFATPSTRIELQVDPPTEYEPVRDDSQIALLGAAAAIVRLVKRLDPERIVPEPMVNGVFQVLYPWVRKADEPFPRYFTGQAGKFAGDRLYLRCDDKRASVFVLADGTEEEAGGCHYGACVHMAIKGDWQELTEAEAKAMAK